MCRQNAEILNAERELGCSQNEIIRVSKGGGKDA